MRSLARYAALRRSFAEPAVRSLVQQFRAVRDRTRPRLCESSGPSSLSLSSLPQNEQKPIQPDERVPLSPVFSGTGPTAGVFTQPRPKAADRSGEMQPSRVVQSGRSQPDAPSRAAECPRIRPSGSKRHRLKSRPNEFVRPAQRHPGVAVSRVNHGPQVASTQLT